MSTAFYVFVNVMVPLSGAFLFLLLLPFPQRARRMVNNALNKIFLLPGPLGLSTISSILLVLSAFFVHVTYQLYDYTSKFSMEVSKHEPPKVSLSEHRLVRAQRNFWVGLLLIVFWMVLSMLLRLSKKIVEQDAELATYRAGAPRGKAATSSSATTSIKASDDSSAQSAKQQKSEQKREPIAAPIDEDEDEFESRDEPAGRADRKSAKAERSNDAQSESRQRKKGTEREARADVSEEKRQRNEEGRGAVAAGGSGRSRKNDAGY